MATLNKMLEPGLKTQPHVVQSHYRGPVKFDITGFYCM